MRKLEKKEIEEQADRTGIRKIAVEKWLKEAIRKADQNLYDRPEDNDFWSGYKNACVSALWVVLNGGEEK